MRLFVCCPGADISTADVYRGLCGALERAGHEVLTYEFSGRLDQAGSWLHHLYKQRRKHEPEVPRPTPGDVVYHAVSGVFERALRYQPDVVLVISAMWFPPDAMLLLRRAGFFVATVLTESPYDDGPQAKIAALSNVCWTNERTSVDVLKGSNPRTHYLRHAFDPARHNPSLEDESDVPAHDVVFVGSGFEERVDLLNAVDWTGIDLGLYGSWTLLGPRNKLRQYVRGGPIPNKKAAALYRRAKIGLNLYRTSMGFGRGAPKIELAESLSPRAYELAACGAFHVSDYRAEVAETFGDLVPTFETPKELEALIRRYLVDDGARAAISGRLPAAVAGHTFDARAAQMIEDIGRVCRR